MLSHNDGAVKRLRVVIRGVGLIALPFILLACADSAHVIVVERPQPPTEKINIHWVSPGETLYAIAWRYNMDPERLARANGIRSPYRLNAGQQLTLILTTVPKARTPVVASQPSVVKKKKKSSPQVSKRFDGFTAWQWPAKGNVSRRFSSKSNALHKGLDIRGKRGQSVYAANTGVVVYAGAGLPAYGKLLIVKHNETYLSAYAHNSQLLVKEGDKVKVGQQIAEMGKSGTTYEHLHFEIRKKGVPVNPLTVLPSKK
ncbi:MAG: peptidoglycan DD-metalloendopeptidase family protein [Cellvibrionales bacterium]|jgi:lipoprotein NlpD|nr:peptidoglycan DD-metalloendopeptidase family protein [Cellvibrionales bacterium]